MPRKEYMAHWNSSPHPISDIRDWSNAFRLETNGLIFKGGKCGQYQPELC